MKKPTANTVAARPVKRMSQLINTLMEFLLIQPFVTDSDQYITVLRLRKEEIE